MELDGRHHYADADGGASPALYAEMVREDRALRLAGYEVFRFGGYELTDPTLGADYLTTSSHSCSRATGCNLKRSEVGEEARSPQQLAEPQSTDTEFFGHRLGD